MLAAEQDQRVCGVQRQQAGKQQHGKIQHPTAPGRPLRPSCEGQDRPGGGFIGIPIVFSAGPEGGLQAGKWGPVSLQIVPSHVVLRRIAALKEKLAVPGDPDVLHRSQLFRLNGRQAGFQGAVILDAVSDPEVHLRQVSAPGGPHGDFHLLPPHLAVVNHRLFRFRPAQQSALELHALLKPGGDHQHAKQHHHGRHGDQDSFLQL